MYLSRLQLNSHNRHLWRTLIDQPYKLHQFVMRGFPDGIKRQNANVLHRLDVFDTAVTLLVQSDISPNWHGLDDRLLLPATPFNPVPNPTVQEMNGLRLDNGRIFRFRLRANTTRRLGKSAGENKGKRVELYREDAQLAWLQKKGEDHGFRTLDVQIIPEGKQTDNTRRLTLYTVQFDGRLQITDPDKALAAVKTGIGPAKAFGCGLLSLAPG
jgi:CRISPR system Cascade subunit CasE